VCVCAAAELVEVDALAVLNEAVGLSLLRPSLPCARHIEGRRLNSKDKMESTETRDNIISAAIVKIAV